MSTNTYLKEERQRLGYGLEAMALLGGVSRKSQVNYENGTSNPDAAYLAMVARHGVDVLFVVTGERNARHSNAAAADSVSIEEWRVLTRYRNAPNLLKAAAVQVLITRIADLDAPPASDIAPTYHSQFISSGGGYMIHSPVTTYNNQGDVNVAGPASRAVISKPAVKSTASKTKRVKAI
jgi:transcriptional regulator with XRE-family HTH domain